MIEHINITELKPYEFNNKKHTKEQIIYLANSIKEFGFNQPVVVDENNIIIAGHARYEAAKSLNITTLPVIKKEDLSQDQVSAYRIADNKISELADWHFDNINLEIGKLVDNEFPIEDFGLGEFSIDALEEEVSEDDYNELIADVPFIKLGDLIELGRHRILCGDSTKEESYTELLQGQKADMVFTDPPYGVSYQSNMRVRSAKFEVLENDDTILTSWIPFAANYSTGFVFIWSSWKVIGKWLNATKELGEITNLIVWDKGGGGIGDLKKTFSTDYEIALVWHRNTELSGKRLGSVWSIGKDAASNYNHPTQKPVELAGTALNTVTNKRDIVLDVFLGSGSTLIACEQLNRVCYGMELEPKYCQVILDRYIKFKDSQDLDIKINGEPFNVSKYLETKKETADAI